MGYLAAFGVVILLIIGIYSFGYAAKQTSLLFVVVLETVFGLILILPLLFFVDKIGLYEIFTMPTKQSWLWLGAAALLGFVLGNFFSLMHIKEAGEKLNSLLSPAITALTIVLSYFFLHDKLAIYQWLGIIVALAAIILFLLKQNDVQSNKQSYKAVFSGLATIICISFTIICTIKGVGSLSFLLAIWLRLFVAFIILLPTFIISNKAKTFFAEICIFLFRYFNWCFGTNHWCCLSVAVCFLPYFRICISDYFSNPAIIYVCHRCIPSQKNKTFFLFFIDCSCGRCGNCTLYALKKMVVI